MESPKFNKFDISEVTYKVVNGQDIKAFTIIPKNTSAGKHPVIVKFHGGNFVRFSPAPLEIVLTSLRSLGLPCILIGFRNGHWTTASSILPC